MGKLTGPCATDADHDREVPETDLFSPLSIRDLTFRNRIVMSPMCQYSAHEGLVNDWHLVHLGSRAAGGVGLVMVEATAVTKEGRITYGDLGIWGDEHIEPLKRIVDFVKSQGAIVGIQLAHAGRKASYQVPTEGGMHLTVDQGRWETVGPSPISFDEGVPPPRELSLHDIDTIVDAFKKGVERALQAGFQLIEIHAAHGYLLHEFLSPLCNRRTDHYGGSLENRMRLLLRVAEELRRLIPKGIPLFVRISATDWVEGGWDIEQSVIASEHLKNLGVDLIDVSSGGAVPKADIPVSKGYQIPFAKAIREQAKIKTGAVGLITETQQANEVITSGAADLVFLGRELLRDPYWAIKAEHEFSMPPSWPIQYGYAVKRRAR
jgi:2,4-dienoyl-CoA reductase-like NADH-dependent reductase (Old Yellow Enzyme family)